MDVNKKYRLRCMILNILNGFVFLLMVNSCNFIEIVFCFLLDWILIRKFRK